MARDNDHFIPRQRPRPDRVICADSATRKTYPMAGGLLDYFPDALAEVSRHSFLSNQKHNPGEPMHHARGKSMDHADCIMRHLTRRGGFDGDARESTALAWRALALLQEELERDLDLPLPRAASRNRQRRPRACAVAGEAEWEPVTTGHDTNTLRLAVPGGWLYLVKPWHGEPALAFVPTPAARFELMPCRADIADESGDGCAPEAIPRSALGGRFPRPPKS